MSKVLTMQEILNAAQECNMPGTTIFVEKYEDLTTSLAGALAKHLSIANSDAESEGPHIGGIAVAFGPILESDVCPAVIDQADITGEWELLRPRIVSLDGLWPIPL